jgi:hypothetical protein
MILGQRISIGERQNSEIADIFNMGSTDQNIWDQNSTVLSIPAQTGFTGLEEFEEI